MRVGVHEGAAGGSKELLAAREWIHWEGLCLLRWSFFREKNTRLYRGKKKAPERAFFGEELTFLFVKQKSMHVSVPACFLFTTPIAELPCYFSHYRSACFVTFPVFAEEPRSLYSILSC